LISRKSIIQPFVVVATILIARVAFDLTSAAAYVYPEFDFGQSGVALVIFVVGLACVLILALARLYQMRFFEGVALLFICYAPLSFDDTINRQFWKFSIHKLAYQSVMQIDPGPLPKYRVFNWGNRNTQLWGGGFIVEGVVYDESDDLARWSPEWTVRRSGPPPEDRWITIPPQYPSCNRRVEPLGEHFYYVSDEC
jgi:hypothetical protein